MSGFYFVWIARGVDAQLQAHDEKCCYAGDAQAVEVEWQKGFDLAELM